MLISIKSYELVDIYKDATDANIKAFFDKINGNYGLCEDVFKSIRKHCYEEEGIFNDYIQAIKDGVIHLLDYKTLLNDGWINEDGEYNNCLAIEEIAEDLYLIIE